MKIDCMGGGSAVESTDVGIILLPKAREFKTRYQAQ